MASTTLSARNQELKVLAGYVSSYVKKQRDDGRWSEKEIPRRECLSSKSSASSKNIPVPVRKPESKPLDVEVQCKFENTPVGNLKQLEACISEVIKANRGSGRWVDHGQQRSSSPSSQSFEMGTRDLHSLRAPIITPKSSPGFSPRSPRSVGVSTIAARSPVYSPTSMPMTPLRTLPNAPAISPPASPKVTQLKPASGPTPNRGQISPTEVPQSQTNREKPARQSPTDKPATVERDAKGEAQNENIKNIENMKPGTKERDSTNGKPADVLELPPATHLSSDSPIADVLNRQRSGCPEELTECSEENNQSKSQKTKPEAKGKSSTANPAEKPAEKQRARRGQSFYGGNPDDPKQQQKPEPQPPTPKPKGKGKPPAKASQGATADDDDPIEMQLAEEHSLIKEMLIMKRKVRNGEKVMMLPEKEWQTWDYRKHFELDNYESADDSDAGSDGASCTKKAAVSCLSVEEDVIEAGRMVDGIPVFDILITKSSQDGNSDEMVTNYPNPRAFKPFANKGTSLPTRMA